MSAENLKRNEDPMNESPMTPALIAAGSLFLIAGLFVGIRAFGVFDTKTFGVAQENADTDVFRRSEAYREGLQRDFDELTLAYAQAKPEDKPAILATLRHRAEGAPSELVPATVRSLIGQ